MEELIVAPPLQAVFDKLAAPMINKVGILRECRQDMVKLQDSLQLVQLAIQDVEERQLKDRELRICLSKLRDVAYDADDLLEIGLRLDRDGRKHILTIISCPELASLHEGLRYIRTLQNLKSIAA